MLLPQVCQDAVKIADEFDIDALLLIDGNLIPTRLRPVAVVVPLEKSNIVFAEQLVEKSRDVVAHIRTSEVEDELVARLRTRASGKIQDPVGMFAVQVGIRIDHL